MKIHHLSGYIQSMYLVEYSHGLLLLDAGSRADIPMLKEFIEHKLQRPFSDLRVLIVTHMHPDHAGAAHRLRKLTHCQIVSARRDKHWYGGFSGFMMHLADMLLALLVASRLGKPMKNIWYPRKLKPDVLLGDGERVPYFEEWQVLETVGHTDRDLSVIHVPSKQTYVGDIILKIKSVYIAPFPIFHPNKYRASLQRYLDLGISQMMLAHGGQVDISADEIQKLQNRAPLKPKTHLRYLQRAAKRHLNF